MKSPIFRELFEVETALKLVFLAKAYEDSSRDIWDKLCCTQDWVGLLRREKQTLSEINGIPPTELAWLDLVNLYGYMIGEQVFTMRALGLADELSKLPGNHPYRFALGTLKGFDKAVEGRGRLASYYATYAIEGVCTFSYVALRSHTIRQETRSRLMKELSCPLADRGKDIALREKEAVKQIRVLEEYLRSSDSIVLDESNTCVVLRHLKAIVSDMLPSIKKWIYLTYAEASKEHARAVTRMSTRFSFPVLVCPDFAVEEKGEIRVERLHIPESFHEKDGPREETSVFIVTRILPEIENEEYKELISRLSVLQ